MNTNYRMAADYNVQGGHFGAPGLHGCNGMAGGCGCGGNCGMGLFETGLSFTGWGWPEWAIVAVGGYMLMSSVFTTQRASRRVSRAFKGAVRGARQSNPARRRRRR